MPIKIHTTIVEMEKFVQEILKIRCLLGFCAILAIFTLFALFGISYVS